MEEKIIIDFEGEGPTLISLEAIKQGGIVLIHLPKIKTKKEVEMRVWDLRVGDVFVLLNEDNKEELEIIELLSVRPWKVRARGQNGQEKVLSGDLPVIIIEWGVCRYDTFPQF
jgi:hypothetical protein